MNACQFLRAPARRDHPRPGCCGFSLIEVLLASVIMAAAGSLLYGSLLQAARARQLRQEQAIAMQLLANRLALLEEVAVDEMESGEFESPHEVYHWELVSENGPSPSLAQVELSVTWPHRPGEPESSQGRRALDVTTYRPIPDAE